jgi:2-polyprenyl-3-methyl-5-hydroxy-6-metoxy-1,4-benzoquinol methylase
MTVKEHYDKHLANFYSWYMGDFETNKNSFKTVCTGNGIKPHGMRRAIDLGAGNGIQTIALAELGFNVSAIDFNAQLIHELKSKIGALPIEVFNDDIRSVGNYAKPQPELIVCCGDTIAHLESSADIRKLINDCYGILTPGGRLVLTFRDYSTELSDTSRFIPVKSDTHRILTCFIEYFTDYLRVTDLLHEFENGAWIQKVSSYRKTRVSRESVAEYIESAGFTIRYNNVANRMITLIGQKS